MTDKFQASMTGIRIMPDSGTLSEMPAAAIDAASIDSVTRQLLDDTDRTCEREDASAPTALAQSAATK